MKDMEEPPVAKIEPESQLLRVDPQNSIDPKISSEAVTHLPILPAPGKLNSSLPSQLLNLRGILIDRTN